MLKNLHLRKLTRSRILEKKDLKNGIRLDRNEKVDNWDKQEIINLIKKQPDSLALILILQDYKISKNIDVDESYFDNIWY